MPRKILLAIPVILIAISLGLLLFAGLNKNAPSQMTTTAPSPPASTASAQAALSQIKTVEGTITQVAKDKITVKTETTEETFTLIELLEVGRQAKTQATQAATTKATVTDLKVGQQVRIVGTKDTNSARLILIME